MTVSAIGRNSFPSTPSSVRIGRYTSTMMSSPKSVGLRTSTDASLTTSSTLVARALEPEPPLRVLDQDDRAVDDEAEVDRAERHQACRRPRSAASR